MVATDQSRINSKQMTIPSVPSSSLNPRQPHREGNWHEQEAGRTLRVYMLPQQRAGGGMSGIGMFSAQSDPFYIPSNK